MCALKEAIIFCVFHVSLLVKLGYSIYMTYVYMYMQIFHSEYDKRKANKD